MVKFLQNFPTYLLQCTCELLDNNLSGYLPSEFGKLASMRILQLDNNCFDGEIPSSYGNLSGIVKISLRNCSLQGVIPDLSRLSNLSYIDLSGNRLTGSIPSYRLSNSMTTIDLSDNQLSGSIPESLSDLPSLQKLSLENNLLNGSISAKLWQNKSSDATARLLLDFRNNSLSSINGALNPPENASLSDFVLISKRVYTWKFEGFTPGNLRSSSSQFFASHSSSSLFHIFHVEVTSLVCI